VGFIKCVLSGANCVQTLILGWLQEPEIKLDGLTQVPQRRETSITGAGLTPRFTPEAAGLLQRALERLSAEQMEVDAIDIPLLKQFSAVIVEDGTSIVLPPELAQVWRGCSGTAGMGEAAIKMFVRWDVLSRELQGRSMEQGRCNDKRGPFAVEKLPDGCLYMVDLGFFGVQRPRRWPGVAGPVCRAPASGSL
jgi:hypothetical protein